MPRGRIFPTEPLKLGRNPPPKKTTSIPDIIPTIHFRCYVSFREGIHSIFQMVNVVIHCHHWDSGRDIWVLSKQLAYVSWDTRISWLGFYGGFCSGYTVSNYIYIVPTLDPKTSIYFSHIKPIYSFMNMDINAFPPHISLLRKLSQWWPKVSSHPLFFFRKAQKPSVWDEPVLLEKCLLYMFWHWSFQKDDPNLNNVFSNELWPPARNKNCGCSGFFWESFFGTIPPWCESWILNRKKGISWPICSVYWTFTHI